MPLLKRIAARPIGFDGAYHRFTGRVTIEKFEGSMRVERFDDRAIWELMYFGKARPVVGNWTAALLRYRSDDQYAALN